MTAAAPIRVGLIGCGAISTQHLEAIRAVEATEIAAVASQFRVIRHDFEVCVLARTGQREGLGQLSFQKALDFQVAPRI